MQKWYFENNPDKIFPVIVDEWVNLNEHDRKEFVKNVSDHSLLYSEIL